MVNQTALQILFQSLIKPVETLKQVLQGIKALTCGTLGFQGRQPV